MQIITKTTLAGSALWGRFGALVSFLVLLVSCAASEAPRAVVATPPASPSALSPSSVPVASPSAPVATPTTSRATITTTTIEPTTTAVTEPGKAWRSDVYTIGTVDPSLSPEEAEVVESYLAYREAYLEAEMVPVDPNHPGLEAYATDPALGIAQRLLNGYVRDGIAARLAEPSSHRLFAVVEWMEAGDAILDVCDVNDVVLYEVASGEIVNGLVVSRVIVAEMVHIDGSWRLFRQLSPSKVEGIDGCARHWLSS